MWSAILRMGPRASRSSRIPSTTGWFTARGCGRRVSLKRRKSTRSSASRKSRLTATPSRPQPPVDVRELVQEAGLAHVHDQGGPVESGSAADELDEARDEGGRAGCRRENHPASSRARSTCVLPEPERPVMTRTRVSRARISRAGGPCARRGGRAGGARRPDSCAARPVSRHHPVHSLREAPGRMVAALLQELVAGRHLHEDGGVASGRHRHADEGHSHAQDREGLLAQPQPVVLLARLPALELHRELHPLARPDRGHAVEVLDVEDAEAPDLHVVAGELGGVPHEGVGHALDLHHVVGHQPMARGR